MTLEFIPLFFGDSIRRINPRGTVGLLTLWSQPDYVLRRLRQAHINLDPATSPIAAVGTLYGNGLRELLRNLLHNPQIDTLLVLGRNRSGSLEELSAFFQHGLEPCSGAALEYVPVGGRSPRAVRIRGTSRVIDDLVRPEDFARPPRIRVFGTPQDKEALDRLRDFLASYAPESGGLLERVEIPLPQVRVSTFPSNPRAHVICADEPLGAWLQLISVLHRFGRPVTLAKGKRRELQNVKVVVERPGPISSKDLDRFGLDPDRLGQYQQDILSPLLAGDETYTYGHRLRRYFGVDALTEAARRLVEDPQDRKAYVVLWDPRRDLTAPKGHPCLVSLFFRTFQDALTLTATFRTHNALDAWLVNFYGLMAILDFVASKTGIPPGPITVVSHSISLDESQMDRAALIAAQRPFGYREDPMGYFRISLDRDAIVVEHRHGDITLKEYRHPKASKLQHEIARDGALSDINHALYLGRQLERAEWCLRTGTPFVQE
ncbi:thymidylate synthase [Desulfacinum hydrothermale DSM 13146]|uniref:Thymidylate synthase n=1 Tax=Desulfacinum hydrothermale DSM 13146 TaxID=1121390 RepID=A0A1W1XFT9_9BACT|nr:thymidylate synthase [Desulfacinum hydrothermale]SMC22833.1 thymidylate synthase [Desulfacinum hydrothermale DSM 13146]